jgi:hypothetical protein
MKVLRVLLSAFLLAFAYVQIAQASCFLYPCDTDLASDTCRNTTEYWVSSSKMADGKYCECCRNTIVSENTTSAVGR